MTHPDCDKNRLVCPAIAWAEEEIVRLRRAVHLPLTENELKLVDKNCDWVAFKHAWNVVMKSRLERIETLG
jgi:hypothetical protein